MLFWHGNAHNNGQASRQNIGLLAQVTASPASTLCLILAMAFPAGAAAGGRSGQIPCCAAHLGSVAALAARTTGRQHLIASTVLQLPASAGTIMSCGQTSTLAQGTPGLRPLGQSAGRGKQLVRSWDQR